MEKKDCSKCEATGLGEDFIFCPYCGEEFVEVGRCSSCRFQNLPDAKFCQQCGGSLAKEKKRRPSESKSQVQSRPGRASSKGITIEFGNSSSANFEFALESAEQFETFEEFGEGRKAIHRVMVPPEKIEKTIELVEYVRNWKSARIYLDGERTTWNSVYGFLWCYQERNSSYRPEQYCFGYEQSHQFNLWGCMQARMSFNEYGEWLCFGRWVGKDGTWKFDKDRIRHELEKKLFDYRFCPAFNSSLIEDVLRTIPDTVNPQRTKDWKFLEDWAGDETSGGLVVIRREHGYEEKTVMKGVIPRRTAIKKMIDQLRLRISDKEIPL